MFIVFLSRSPESIRWPFIIGRFWLSRDVRRTICVVCPIGQLLQYLDWSISMVRGNLNCESHGSTIQGRKVGLQNMHKKAKFLKIMFLYPHTSGDKWCIVRMSLRPFTKIAKFMTLSRGKTLWWGQYRHIVKM